MRRLQRIFLPVIVGTFILLARPVRGDELWEVSQGTTTLWLAIPDALVAAGQPDRSSDDGSAQGTVQFAITGGTIVGVASGPHKAQTIQAHVTHRGGVIITTSTGEVSLASLVITVAKDAETGDFVVVAAGSNHEEGLVLRDTVVQFDRIRRSLVLSSGNVRMSAGLAAALGRPDLADGKVGMLLLRAKIKRIGASRLALAEPLQPVRSSPLAGSSMGPDVIVGELINEGFFGRVNGISAFSVGTRACNIGDQPANWFGLTNKHPVITQNMYRLKNSRFEQIGMSWVKHGFFAQPGENFCQLGCQNPGGANGTLLGVGCSDPYSASLNGEQANMGPRSQVNPHTGDFPFPFTAPAPSAATIGRRLQVSDTDLDPALNAGALYFVEGQYVMADDAAAGNNNNNASYRPITIMGPDAQNRFTYVLASCTQQDQFAGCTQQEQVGIRAWQDTDSSVVETDIPLPGEGLFVLAAQATDLGTGFWDYEYALQNLNSDRAGGSFTIPLPSGAIISNMGFHDVDYHSGEVYDSTDWPATVTTNTITWATDGFAVNPNANALRWGTLYNFRFTANVKPGMTTVTLGLFKPGGFPSVTASTLGPLLSLIDCNGNTIADACDLSCSAPNCVAPCATSEDCDQNGVPDECQTDCNNNQNADPCDVTNGVSNDCNGNMVPDECEADCDGDGIPDECDVFDDTDGDAVPDCFDLCPFTIPLGSCVCPPAGQCCFPPSQGGFCVGPIPPDDCLNSGGTPDCLASQLCRDGCLLGDADDDGELDLYDFAILQRCFSGGPGQLGFTPPSSECARVFDFDADGSVDQPDYKIFQNVYTGACAVDSDADGVPNCHDACPVDPNKIVPGVCGCQISDTDTDGDGVLDCLDGCPQDPFKVEPQQCGCGVSDVDSDGDGTLDCHDGCPGDPFKIEPQQCGCGVEDVDSDGDGIADCVDGCPQDPFKTVAGQCGCGVPETDTDGDGVPDCVDGCPLDPTQTLPGACP